MACGRTVPRICLGVCFAVPRSAAALAGLLLLIGASAAPVAAQTDPIKATVQAKVTDGEFAYARIVFTLSEDDDVHARIANNVLVISFDKPIDVVVDRIPAQIPEYVGAA